MKINKLTQAIALSLVLSGCANLAPEYEQPEVAIAENWVDVALREQSAGEVAPSELGWREFFTDPRLQKLIETALAYNHDLKTAALNVELAQAQYRITKTEELPSVSATGSGTRARSSGVVGESYSVGLGISNFELDFFGRVKNLSEADLNSYLATKEARDASQLSVISAVAKGYYQWRTSRALRDLAKQTLATRKESYQLTKLRFQEGVSSGTDLSTTSSAVATAESSYQEQERNTLQAENALATLVGQPLSTLNLPKGKKLTQQFPDKQLFAGVPSQVLLNRPDIRQAEYTLKAQNANIGAARAALFPTISLTASTGFSSTDLSDLISGGSKTWSIGPSISLPIFDRGKLKAGVKVSEINQKIAVESYQSAVQSAFQDVSDALVARKTLAEQYAAEKRGQAATSETLRLVRLQVQEGLADGLTLLDAERTDFTTRQGTLATLLTLTDNQVDLYIALGGGLKETALTAEPAKTAEQAEQ